MERNFQSAVLATTDKGQVRGYSYDGVNMFKGIPYARAKRFHAPEPVEAWEGVFEATSYGYVCPLLDMGGRPNGELLVPHRYWIMNEDCQNLNVWTPACDDGKRPVMVWLHGGGFEAGSAIEQVAYEGENMCKHGDVVVVSVNHRLNILGYMDLSDFGEEYANSANAGTDDIVAALQWIHMNIAAFGGDPENVVVFGQSGGGAKVTTLLQTPAADGLIAKGINMSGVIGPILADQKGSGEEIVRAIMAEIGISTVKELEEVPYSTFAAAYLKLRPSFAEAGKYVGCAPKKNDYYMGEPIENGFRPETAGLPLMVGSVFGEFSSFAPCPYDRNHMSREEGNAVIVKELGEEAAAVLLPMFEAAYPDRNPVDLLRLDFFFRLPELDYNRKRAALNDCTYAYMFDLDLPMDGGRTPWHCSDIPYFFHNTELVPITQEAGVTDRLENEIFGATMAFAHTGNPNHAALPEWPACTTQEEHVMVFSKNSCVKTNYDAELVPTAAKYIGEYVWKSMEASGGEIQH